MLGLDCVAKCTRKPISNAIDTEADPSL